ncbi:hypothetical protein BZJ21_14880 [Salinivibrio costicola subsp. alcaliphilus]|uniref:Uncharacterized protein n=1 Tax=Salinivibrio costicola subsp. alcaliphilus TaxID=272773 RepID=A0ABX3KMI3_SALCS|nr:hypothetical protein BZJ21_14880 [Salinivibrio costicola subsp. alcaliphilus]
MGDTSLGIRPTTMHHANGRLLHCAMQWAPVTIGAKFDLRVGGAPVISKNEAHIVLALVRPCISPGVEVSYLCSGEFGDAESDLST